MLVSILTGRVDASLASVCRIVVGAAAVIEIAAKGPLNIESFAEQGIVRAPNFGWLPEPGQSAAAALFAVGLLAAISFSVGLLTRTSGVVVACTMGYRLALDQNLYSNHAYLLVLVTFLLMLADAGAAISVDAKLRWRRVPDIPKWPLTLIRVQISLMYLFAALAKLNPIFLSGEVLRIRSRLPLLVGSGDSLVAAAWLVVSWELFLAAAFWSRRLRRIAFLSGLMFHAGIVLLMEPFPSTGLVVFGMVSVSCYLLFFDFHRARPRQPGPG